jgi:hypothetical protein
LQPDQRFVVLVGLISIPVVYHGLRAISNPAAPMIQTAVRSGIMNLIPYSAALALLVGGLPWAVAIFALAIAAIFTSARFRVT